MSKKFYLISGFSIAVLLAVCAFFAYGIPIQTVKTDIATARVLLFPKNIFQPHSSDNENRLTIGKKTFRKLRGAPPFYIKIPELKSILFVTAEPKHPYPLHLHVLSLEDGKDVEIDITGSGFGWNIGSGRKPEEKFSDFVEHIEPGKIVIATHGLDWKHTMLIDLPTKSIEREETIHY